MLGRNKIGAFGRKIVDAIVAHAECGFEFLDGKQLNGVHAETSQMFQFFDDVQKRATALLADIAAGLVLRPPGADVKLIDDEIVEPRRLPPLVMPRIGLRIANDAVAAGKGWRFRQFACERIPSITTSG